MDNASMGVDLAGGPDRGVESVVTREGGAGRLIRMPLTDEQRRRLTTSVRFLPSPVHRDGTARPRWARRTAQALLVAAAVATAAALALL